MKRVANGELRFRSRNDATDELTMNPGRAIFRGSFVYARIRKGLRAFRLSAVAREIARASAESPPPAADRPLRAESSLFLSLTDPIQLALRVDLDRRQPRVNRITEWPQREPASSLLGQPCRDRTPPPSVRIGVSKVRSR